MNLSAHIAEWAALTQELMLLLETSLDEGAIKLTMECFKKSVRRSTYIKLVYWIILAYRFAP